jgi:hypothetical protein
MIKPGVIKPGVIKPGVIKPGDAESTDRTPPPAIAAMDGGDPACWAHRLCQQCGRLNDVERPEVCQACGAAFAPA